MIPECIALYNYSGEAGDLSFSEGDVIKVHKDEGEWWEGSLRGGQGLFPANYVKKKETEVRVWQFYIMSMFWLRHAIVLSKHLLLVSQSFLKNFSSRLRV